VVADALGRPGTVLVLGGTSEIGLAIARALVARGARTVVLAGRDLDALAQAASTLGADTDADTDAVAFDAERPEEHASVIASVVQRHGDLDLVVLAVGALGDQARDEVDPVRVATAVLTNFAGPAAALTAAANQLRRQGHGAVVVLSSVAGERVRRSNYVYGAGKAGLDGFALALGEALRGTGARVLVVRPGFVRTRMTRHLPDAPLATTPDEVAAAVLDGLDRRAELVWVPARLQVVMSALRHVPRPLFRRLPL
jgi:decaprenylphospho-beta-D-erythro-pentofuranosid-2-ulose 2-reductase